MEYVPPNNYYPNSYYQNNPKQHQLNNIKNIKNLNYPLNKFYQKNNFRSNTRPNLRQKR